MTVASVEAIPVAYPEPNDHSRLRSVCLVKITNTDGASAGANAAPTSRSLPRRQGAGDGLAEIVVGRDEVQTEAIWRALKDHSWWYGTGAGLASIAISGIDIALWDLKGKVLAAPSSTSWAARSTTGCPPWPRSTRPRPPSPRWWRRSWATSPAACRA
jgi:L-alanine-DL-glutamate epimerase-like enolase superfamily enzyme